jgi:hypothetical protein
MRRKAEAEASAFVEDDIPQGLKPLNASTLSARAKALAYLFRLTLLLLV